MHINVKEYLILHIHSMPATCFGHSGCHSQGGALNGTYRPNDINITLPEW